MKNGKRIQFVTLKRMHDDSPDTSHMGEYANSPTSEFSIDRAHDLDCICQTYNRPTAEGLRVLESAQQYLCDRLNEFQDSASETEVPFEIVEWYDDGDTFIHDFLEGDEELCLGSCRGSWNRREYRYFNPSFNYVDKAGKPTEGNSADDVIKYTRQDFERMESLNADQWCYIGIRAEAEIQVEATWENSVVSKVSWSKPIAPYQTITSGGLWGIESDSDHDYLESVEKEELTELRGQLKALGFSSRAISISFKTIERKGE